MSEPTTKTETTPSTPKDEEAGIVISGYGILFVVTIILFGLSLISTMSGFSGLNEVHARLKMPDPGVLPAQEFHFIVSQYVPSLIQLATGAFQLAWAVVFAGFTRAVHLKNE